jgi:uncharacterized membrane-anchored protein YjiN (DUF445 family)
LGDPAWLSLLSAGFDAGLVGGLADWFAVTALFRHPLGIPIPHTAIIPKRRAKIVDGIVTMVERDWLSPEVIGTRLAKLAPSEIVLDWLQDPTHVQRLSEPLRDLLAGLARLLSEDEVVELVERTLQRQLREVPIDVSASRWLAGLINSERSAVVFDSFALSLANLASRPDATEHVRRWLDRSARQLREEGKILVPLFLRRRIVQRKLVEAACDYAASELRGAAAQLDHPLRQTIFGALGRLADRLAAGDPELLARAEQLRGALLESLEAGPLVRDVLARIRRQLERDLAASDGYLANLIDRQLRGGIVDGLKDPARRATFDRWVRATVDALLRRHHHQIGITVRENLTALDTDKLVAQIENRVGPDLQFIRLNGALVGGLIGVLLALAHRAFG